MIVGAIGDLHLPFTHPNYLRFVRDTFKTHGVEQVVFIGDIVDGHALGFWDHNPDGRSAGDECQQAKDELKRWKCSIKDGLVCIGNHDQRQFRVAHKAGLPARFLKDYADVWDTPGWKWDFEHWIDGVLYTHGTGTSGKDAAINLAIQKRASTVIGHVHTYAGVKYHSNSRSLIFGMNVGCGIDCQAYAFDYGRDFPVRPVLGCGIVRHGREAYFIPMPCSPKDRYHRRKP